MRNLSLTRFGYAAIDPSLSISTRIGVALFYYRRLSTKTSLSFKAENGRFLNPLTFSHF